jgi:hypothetical protein
VVDGVIADSADVDVDSNSGVDNLSVDTVDGSSDSSVTVVVVTEFVLVGKESGVTVGQSVLGVASVVVDVDSVATMASGVNVVLNTDDGGGGGGDVVVDEVVIGGVVVVSSDDVVVVVVVDGVVVVVVVIGGGDVVVASAVVVVSVVLVVMAVVVAVSVRIIIANINPHTRT